MKARVVQEIRANQEMEREVDAMDIKIGLLVKNRIDLEVGVGMWVVGVWGEVYYYHDVDAIEAHICVDIDSKNFTR